MSASATHDPTTGLRFRSADATDVPAVVDLVQSAYRGEPSRIGWTTEADLIEGQRIDPAMLQELLDRPRTVVLLAEAEELLACCELSIEGDPNIAYFGMFAVRPDRQTAGIGSRLLEHAERTAIDGGASTMRLVTIHLRSELIAWYQRRGYEPTGTTHRFPYDEPRYGRPMRDDLTLVEFTKTLSSR